MCLISSSSFETRSTPALLGATRRAFAFSLGNPISSVPDFLNSKYLSERRVLRSEIEDRFGAGRCNGREATAKAFKHGRRGGRSPTSPQPLLSVSFEVRCLRVPTKHARGRCALRIRS